MQNETRAFRLHLDSGRLLILKSYLSGLAALGDLVKQNTLPHLLPAYLAEWEKNRALAFGPIGLNRDGLTVESQLLPWSEIQSLQRKGGWIAIYKQGGWVSWKKVQLSDVPNAHVLLAIMSHHIDRLGGGIR